MSCSWCFNYTLQAASCTQAEAAYSIKARSQLKVGMSRLLVALCEARHPVFFYWVEDATAEMDSFRNDGYKCCSELLLAEPPAALGLLEVLSDRHAKPFPLPAACQQGGRAAGRELFRVVLCRYAMLSLTSSRLRSPGLVLREAPMRLRLAVASLRLLCVLLAIAAFSKWGYE